MSDGHSRRRFLATAASAAVAFVIAGCTSQKDQSGRTSASGDDTVESFGGRITAGPIDHIKRSIEATQAPYYVAPARAYVSAFPEAQLAGARASYPSEVRAALDAGVVVLYQRCTHLGCRVPYCPSSQWFECPCHGAKFDGVGEYRAGPAPRGLDLMAASVERGNLVIDTATIVPGMPQGTDTTHQDPAGQFCVFF